MSSEEKGKQRWQPNGARELKRLSTSDGYSVSGTPPGGDDVIATDLLSVASSVSGMSSPSPYIATWWLLYAW